MSDAVSVTDAGPVRVVTITRPDVLNAVDGPTADALADAWEAFRDAEGAKVMVLTGSRDAFSTGADLKRIDTLRARGDEGGWLGITRRLDAGKPVIAAVEGHCLAGGLELALVADLRVAGRGATFAVANRRWGVPLVDGGTQRLPRVVGLGRALELVLTARVLDASTALAWGLVNDVVGDGTAERRAVEIARAVSRFPQAALLADRHSVFEGLGMPLAEGLVREAAIGREALDHDELVEGVAAFERRR